MNFQNVPRKDKVVKRAFVPKLDALLYFDYEQIELRLLAFYMAALGDTSMAETIAAGEDLHSASARAALGIRPDVSLSDAERQVGKVLNFSLVYGGGTPTIMRQLDVDFPRARTLLRNFHKQWPGIQIVQAAIDQTINDRGYIKTLFGRHLHPESPHKRLNALVQGCAADLMRNSLVVIDQNIQDEGLESHLVNVVHDEVQLDCVRDEIDFLVVNVPRWMDYAEVSALVPVATSCEISFTNWADKVPLEDYVGRSSI